MSKEIIIKDRDEIYGDTAKYKGYSLFIEAGAGAGKTETLINIVVDQLFNDVPPEKIVVITFTNKATEELVDRVSSILQKKLSDVNLENKQREIIQNAINNLYKMNISTIHHFCNVILSENSYLAKLSFGATLLEENDEDERREYYYNQWFQKELGNNDHKALKGCSITKDKKIRDVYNDLKSTYLGLCDQFDDVKINNEFNIDYKEFFDSIEEVIEYIDNNIGDMSLHKSGEPFFDVYKGILEERNDLDNEEVFEKFINEDSLKSITKNIKFTKGKSKLSKEEVDEANDDLRDYVEKCVAYKELIKEYINIKDYKVLNEYAIKAWEYYKQNRGTSEMSNNQLIYETYKLFNTSKEVKNKLSNEYDIIIVDEFQDTDKYQNKFVTDLAIAIDERKRNEGSYSTTLVLVGDPKQSIYGFRGADFDLFMKTKEDFSKTGIKDAINIFLPDNYRSNQYVLKWVNEKYNICEFYPGYKYNDMLIPEGNKIPSTPLDKILGGVYSYNFNENDNKFNNLANFINSLVEGGYKIYDRKNHNFPFKERNIRYNDFLVLTTSHSEISDYVVAFNKKNVKTIVDGEFDLASSKAFRYLYNILMYVLDGQDNNLHLEKELESNLSKLDYIDKLKEEIKSLTPYGKMLYVFNNIDLIVDNFEDSDKEMLETIIAQISENIAYNVNSSSIQIIDEIEELVNNVATSQLMLNKDVDAVNIMNVHKSKGLGAQIVIFVDSGGSKTSSGNYVDGEYYLNNISLFPDKKEKAKSNKEAEKLRLEYVAATRAKQVLIFESNMKRGKNDSETSRQLFDRDAMNYDLSNMEGFNIPTNLPVINCSIEDETKNFKEIISKGFNKINDNLKKNCFKEISPSSLENYEIIKKEDMIVEYNRPANNIFGTMLHRVMELCILDNCISINKDVEKAFNENKEDFINGQENLYKYYLKECANAIITLFNDNGLFEKYNNKMPEFKFYDFSDDLYLDEPTLINGSMDLVLMNDAEALIIDYKTDNNIIGKIDEFENILISRYKNQLDAYKKVLSRCNNIDNINTKIVWIEECTGKSIAHLLKIE